MMERLGKRARTSSAGPPPLAALTSLPHPSSLPFTAPQPIDPPHLRPVAPAAGGESPESRINSLAHKVRWVFHFSHFLKLEAIEFCAQFQ